MPSNKETRLSQLESLPPPLLRHLVQNLQRALPATESISRDESRNQDRLAAEILASVASLDPLTNTRVTRIAAYHRAVMQCFAMADGCAPRDPLRFKYTQRALNLQRLMMKEFEALNRMRKPPTPPVRAKHANDASHARRHSSGPDWRTINPGAWVVSHLFWEAPSAPANQNQA